MSVQTLKLRKDLVGYWTMDNSDTSGSVLFDRSAYDNHGGLEGNITTGISGEVNEAYSFDNANVDQYVDVENSLQNQLDGNEEASLSMWVRTLTNNPTNNQENTHTGLCSFQGSSSSNTHYPWSDTTLYMSTFRSSRVDEISNNSFDKTNWHLLTITTTPGNNGWKLYQNENLVTSVNGENTVKLDADVLIGWNNNNHFFSGDIGNVRLYNRVLSKDEISTLYNMRSQRHQNVIYPTVKNIRKGCESATFSFVANQWNGSFNRGEIDIVNGTTFNRVNGGQKDISPINNGVALDDNGSGTGYLMYSRQNVHNRFTNSSPHPDNCNHVIGVVYNNGWKYDDNSAADNPFEPRNSDVLIGEFTYAIDSVNRLTGFTR